MQSADHGAPSRWRRAGVDPILQIDRAAFLKVAVHAQSSSINHDRPPLTPDASISTTPNQCKPTLSQPPIFLLSSCPCTRFIRHTPSDRRQPPHISFQSFQSSQPASRHHLSLDFRISPACSPPASPASLSRSEHTLASGPSAVHGSCMKGTTAARTATPIEPQCA